MAGGPTLVAKSMAHYGLDLSYMCEWWPPWGNQGGDQGWSKGLGNLPQRWC